MVRHDPREARTLGLGSASWLGALLLLCLLRLGDLSVQWPVLLVPVLWAAVALRPRGRPRRDPVEPPYDIGHRTDTVERPAVRAPRRDRRP